MLSEMTRGLLETYDDSRRRFLDAADAAGATTNTWEHPMRGIDGEELAIDVASIGPHDADSVLVVVSAAASGRARPRPEPVWDEDTQQTTTMQLLAHAEEVGFPRLQEVVSGGQYSHPTGVFYGGTGPVWSHRWLVDHLRELVGSATRLGPVESVSADLHGDWLGALEDLLPDVEITAVALEFGTVDPVSVLQALRADAVLHAHGDPLGAERLRTLRRRSRRGCGRRRDGCRRSRRAPDVPVRRSSGAARRSPSAPCRPRTVRTTPAH